MNRDLKRSIHKKFIQVEYILFHQYFRPVNFIFNGKTFHLLVFIHCNTIKTKITTFYFWNMINIKSHENIEL